VGAPHAEPSLAMSSYLRMQVYFSWRGQKGTLIAVATILLSGCWTAPNANLRPKGEPRVIEDSIEVETFTLPMRVKSIDRVNRTVVVSSRGAAPIQMRIAAGVRNWDDVRPGDQIRPKLKEQLTVYLAPQLESGSKGVTGWSDDARVLLIDPSYRLLTVQYPNGRTDTFKVSFNTRLKDMEPGDSVAIKLIEAVELGVRRHSSRQ
jgi:hypothetical protein